MHEFRLDCRLPGVAVVDHLGDAISAVYTFFEPSASSRSLGVFGILYLLDYARLHQISHVYLGYWITKCQKMAYKSQYQPFETFHNGRWELFKSR
jgi:arginine-tRNA-protein transferase